MSDEDDIINALEDLSYEDKVTVTRKIDIDGEVTFIIETNEDDDTVRSLLSTALTWYSLPANLRGISRSE